MSRPIRALAVTLATCSTLFAGTACGGRTAVQQVAGNYIVVASPSPSTPAERQKLARTRFLANAGLAAGATYQWIVKPWKAGGFKNGARGRQEALVKAGLAGTFAYNRLRAAQRSAQGDPTLARALAPLAAGIDGLRTLPTRLSNGDESAVSSFADVVSKVKSASRGAGTPVRNQYPTARQLTVD